MAAVEAADATLTGTESRAGGRRTVRLGANKVWLRRVGFYLVAAWAAVTINFLLPRIMPGSPASVMISQLQQQGSLTPAMRTQIETLFGVPGVVASCLSALLAVNIQWRLRDLHCFLPDTGFPRHLICHLVDYRSDGIRDGRGLLVRYGDRYRQRMASGTPFG